MKTAAEISLSSYFQIGTTVVPHLYDPQLYDSPDYTDPILPQIHTIFDVH